MNVLTRRYQLCLPVKISAINKTPGVRYTGEFEVIKLRDWCKFHLEYNTWHVMVGLHKPHPEREQRILTEFWKRYRQFRPHHEIWQMIDEYKIDTSRLCPMVLHGDEGRGRKRAPYLVCSYHSYMGFGTSAANSARKSKPFVSMKLNYAGNSHIHRMLTCVLPKMLKDEVAFKDLLKFMADDSLDMIRSGVQSPHDGQTYRIAVLQVVGDWMFLQKAGSLARSYANVEKRPRGRNACPKGICHLCRAGQLDIPFEDLRMNARWTETMHDPTDDVFVGEPVFLQLPHDAFKPASFFTYDLWHAFHLGVGKTFTGSVLAMLSMQMSGGNIESRFEQLTQLYLDFCDRVHTSPYMLGITKEGIGWPDTNTYPNSQWSKGHITTLMMQFLENYFENNPCDESVEFLDVYLVTPNPPKPSTLGHVAYDVLVVQNMLNFKSGLVTAMSSQEPWEYWSIAAFFPPTLSGLQLVQTARLEAVCQQHGCLLFHGWNETPLNAQPTHQMEEGHGFTVRLRFRASAASSSRGFERVLPEQEAIEAPAVLVVPGDDVTDDLSEFSEQQPEASVDLQPDLEADASPGYSPSDHVDTHVIGNLRSVSVYGLHVDPSHVQILWSTHAQVLGELSRSLLIPPDQVLTFHNMIVRVAGQQPDEESIILQRTHDIPAGSLDQLLLMDLEIHQHPGHDLLPAYPHVIRKVCRVVQHVTRTHLLMHAGVFHYCGHINVLDRCLVHFNDQLWPLQDVRVKQVLSGSYVRVVVPPPIWQVAGTMQTIDRIERQHRHDLPPGMHPYQRPAQVPQEPVASHLVNAPDPRQQSDAVHAGLREQSSGRGGPDPYFQTVRPSPNVGHRSSSLPPLRGIPNHWLLPVGMRVCQHIDHTIDHDDFEVEWITWYLGAPYRPRCDETRILRLDVEQELWYRDLCELWHEYLRIDDWTQVLIVDPNPPKAPYEHHVGHLILVQGELEGHVPVVITTIFRNFAGHRISHHACFVPQFSSTATFVAFLQLERVCLARDCSASIGDFDFPVDGLGEVHAGDNVILHVPARTPHATASFLQLGVRLSPSQAPVSHHYEDDPAERRQMYVREYQRHLPTEEAAIPLILGFEQEVLRRWPQFVQAGPGGMEFQVTIRTWLNDHHRWPICDVPRDVGLFEDINLWRPALMHAWRDRIDPHFPVEFFLVDPDPTDELDSVVAHLIILQRPMEDSKSVLVTVFDDAVWNNLPRRWALRTSVDPTGLEIVALMGYRFLCPPQTSNADCQVWCQGRAIGMQERFLTYHGLSLDLRVYRQDLNTVEATCERLTDRQCGGSRLSAASCRK
eukprot:s3001_g3.t1